MLNEFEAEVRKGVQEGGPDLDPADRERVLGMINGVRQTLAEGDDPGDLPEEPPAPNANADALETAVGDLSVTLGDIAEGTGLNDDAAEAIGEGLSLAEDYTRNGNVRGVRDALGLIEDALAGPGVSPEDRERGLAAVADARRAIDGGGGGGQAADPDAPSTTSTADNPMEPGGSPQQQAAQKVDDTASRLEATIMSVADESGLSDADAELIGGQLDALLAQINAVMAQIRDGGYDEAALAALMGQLSGFEATLMDVADRPGLSDAQAAQIGSALDDLFNDIGALTQSLQGDMTPPPFGTRVRASYRAERKRHQAALAALEPRLRRSYKRQTLGRRSLISLDGSRSLIVLA